MSDDLVAAGWRVIDGLPLEAGLGRFGTREVASAAGVTTGSFFHHFPDVAAFADALVLDLADDSTARIEDLPVLLDALRGQDITDLVRTVMSLRWSTHLERPERSAEFRHEMLAWVNHHRNLSRPVDGLDTVADVLRRRMRGRQDPVTEVWQLVLDRVGRTIVEPFTPERLSTALTALFYGLAIRHAVEPEAVDDDLFADLVSVLIAVLSTPVGADRHISDIEQRLSGAWPAPETSPQARSGARRRAETRARIVQAATGMFGEGWESVTASEVAQRAGVSNQTVANLFGGVRLVAACTFRENLPAVAAAAGGASSLAPEPRLAVIIEEIAVRAEVDPEPARALLAERIATISRHGEVVGEGDVRAEVPLDDLVAGPLRRLVPQTEAATTAATLVHLALTEAVTGTAEPAGTARHCLALVERSAEGG